MTPWTVAYQAPPSMGFSRQECWSGSLLSSPGNLPKPRIEPGYPELQADSLPMIPWKTCEISESSLKMLEKEMATHSSVLAWRIPGTGEPGWLPSIGSHRVGYNGSDLACMCMLEKEMATHSSILAWRVPGTEEPGGLPSMRLHRVGHD